MVMSVLVPGETILLRENLEGRPVHSGHIKESGQRGIHPSHRCYILSWKDGQPPKKLWRTEPLLHQAKWISVEDGCVFWGARVVVPLQGRLKVPILNELIKAHPGKSCMKVLAQSYIHCMVTRHGSGDCEKSEGLQQMSVKPKCTHWSTITPLGVAGTSLVKNSHWLYRTYNGELLLVVLEVHHIHDHVMYFFLYCIS